jgi:hypothetical protein
VSYRLPRRIVITPADIRGLTVLERARGAAIAGVPMEELEAVFRNAASADPAVLERGVTLFYALVWQLERRANPSITWEEAQTWECALDATVPLDAVAEAEAHESVAVALATGLSPRDAGELTMAQVDAYSAIRGEVAARQRRRRGRGAR